MEYFSVATLDWMMDVMKAELMVVCVYVNVNVCVCVCLCFQALIWEMDIFPNNG